MLDISLNPVDKSVSGGAECIVAGRYFGLDVDFGKLDEVFI